MWRSQGNGERDPHLEGRDLRPQDGRFKWIVGPGEGAEPEPGKVQNTQSMDGRKPELRQVWQAERRVLEGGAQEEDGLFELRTARPGAWAVDVERQGAELGGVAEDAKPEAVGSGRFTCVRSRRRLCSSRRWIMLGPHAEGLLVASPPRRRVRLAPGSIRRLRLFSTTYRNNKMMCTRHHRL